MRIKASAQKEAYGLATTSHSGQHFYSKAQSSNSTRPRTERFVAAGLALLFIWLALNIIDNYVGVIELPFDTTVPLLGGSDFPAFYGGTKLFFEDPANAYDPNAQTRAILAAKGYSSSYEEVGSQWYRYYNPPVFSLLLLPLTLLSLQMAFAVTLLLNLVGLALLLYVLSRILGERRAAFRPFAAFVVISVPVNYAFWHAQPTLFLAACFGLALLAMERGFKERMALYWALLFVKPHWLVAPAFVLNWRDRRILLPLAMLLATFSLPFIALGPEGVADYIRLMLSRGQGDLTDEGFAEAVLSWSGFLRGLTGEAQATEALLMSALTLSVFAVVWRQGGLERMALAVPLTLLLVVPHSHPQDWIMLAPGAAFLVQRQYGARLVVSAVLLLGIVLGLHNWAGLSRTDTAFYWPTLMGFVLLLWLAVLSDIDRRNAGRGEPASRYAAAVVQT